LSREGRTRLAAEKERDQKNGESDGGGRGVYVAVGIVEEVVALEHEPPLVANRVERRRKKGGGVN
jgi:hypothetical protein